MFFNGDFHNDKIWEMGLSFERLKNMFETVAELDIDFMGVKINLLEEKETSMRLELRLELKS